MNRQQAGFTIVEVVIALTILSLLMLTMVAAMRTMGDTQTRLQAVIDRSDEMRMVSRFLRRSIGQSMIFSQREADGDEEFGAYFEGSENELVWAAPIIAGPTVGGISVAKLAVSEGSLTIQIQAYTSSLGEEKLDWTDIKKEVLVSNLELLTIGYRADIGEGFEWEDKWERGDFNPRTVRLLIKKQGRFWPELIIGLGVAGIQR